MRKSVLVLLFTLLAIVVTACRISSGSIHESDVNNDQPESTQDKISYDFKSEAYTYKDSITVRYPQIINLNDQDKQMKLNEMIKKRAYGYLDNYSTEDMDTFSLDLNYKVKFKSEHFLSIQFSGYTYDEGAAHPNDIFYSINIDMDKSVALKLKDMVDIDEEFVTEFREGELQSTINEQRSTLNEWTDQEWISMLKDADSRESGISSYLTNDSLGISVEVPHAVGDHAELEISYDEIKQKMNSDIQSKLRGDITP
ncbi:DUF4163 domain-containing protein [Paenibacillus durus]|uniref:Deacetylase PdaC domain-containing protein n=1 Tax=Paenibacillus durus TaxID=44251 RepID=A0A089HX58_PAEDU|nr:DUF4163 domain-containing protein [Paenibacillus durus]AIQ14918.1 hypothetical protein PDUR_25815 [Paenibacillus durus]